jgi:phospholipid/cholesterol/gamma-HCH transport system substrate-binding protein
MAHSRASVALGTGLFVLLGFLALGFLTTQLPGSGLQFAPASKGFLVTAKFDNIGGLKDGAPVTMAGVAVGKVSGIRFDPMDFRAVVALEIDRKYDRLPDDSDASIQTTGLLGANFVALSPGGSSTFLHAGSEIQLTQSALSLENLINKFFANSVGNNSGSNSNGSGASNDSSAPSDSSGKVHSPNGGK